MLRLLTILILAASLTCSDTPIAWGVQVSEVNGTVTDSLNYYLDPLPSAASGPIGWDGATQRISYWSLGSGLSYSSGVLSVTSPTRSFSSVTPSLNAAALLSSTRDVQVTYPVDISVTSLLLTTTQGTATLEYADDSGITTNVVAVCSGTQAVGGVASVTNISTVTLTGIIPAGKYRRIRTTNNSNTPTFTARAGQEVNL